eukprot:356126-Chlamydomonas_euryale.AAC.1
MSMCVPRCTPNVKRVSMNGSPAAKELSRLCTVKPEGPAPLDDSLHSVDTCGSQRTEEHPRRAKGPSTPELTRRNGISASGFHRKGGTRFGGAFPHRAGVRPLEEPRPSPNARNLPTLRPTYRSMPGWRCSIFRAYILSLIHISEPTRRS